MRLYYVRKYVCRRYHWPNEFSRYCNYALIIFGPTKLPQFGRAIGSTLKEFKSAAEHIDEDSHETPSKASKSQREQSK